MRIAVLVFATLGAIACGLTAVYQVGAALAEQQSADRLATADARWAGDADVLGDRAGDSWKAAIVLGVACVFGVCGVVAARRYQRLPAAICCVLGAGAPAFGWLPGLCLSGPIALAAVLALGIRPEEPDPVVIRAKLR